MVLTNMIPRHLAKTLVHDRLDHLKICTMNDLLIEKRV